MQKKISSLFLAAALLTITFMVAMRKKYGY